ncbi:amino acid-binding protein [Halobacteriales archaeon QS_8_69_26]|nr:MAG: amino acid-binding protein [Halobacteriales archaeon QS_8_69_26]
MTDEGRDPEVDVRTYTVRLELADEPGELLRALEPIAESGGNLLSIFHERGSLTPRGRVPVEVDLECPPAKFDDLVESVREAGVDVVRAGAEEYREVVSVVLVGHLVETDLSDTLERLESCPTASVVDLSLNAPEGRDDVSSARIRLAVEGGAADVALSTVREVAEEKDLRTIEPLVEEGPS